MPDRDQILLALRDVEDPEIKVNLVDLGLIYDIEIKESAVNVRMTLTTSACPLQEFIARDVKAAVESLESVSAVEVEFVWEPRWTPDRISPAGRNAMGMV